MNVMKAWIGPSIVVALVTCASYAVITPSAQQRPAATPDTVGVSSERLGRLHQGMQAFVDRHEAGGIVTLIARDGRVVDVHASGFQDVESRTPMKTDTISTVTITTTVESRSSLRVGQLTLVDSTRTSLRNSRAFAKTGMSFSSPLRASANRLAHPPYGRPGGI